MNSHPHLIVSTTEGDIYAILFPTVRQGAVAVGPCTLCDGSVKFYPGEGQPPGVGRCDRCFSRHTLMQCGLCSWPFHVNDRRLRELANDRAVDCENPNCEAILGINQPAVTIVSDMAPAETPWSDDPREAAYLDRARGRLTTPEEQLRFWANHRATASRLRTAGRDMEAILRGENRTFRIDLESRSTDEATKQDTDEPRDADAHYFSFTNSLRSALDMLAQEIATFYKTATPEKDISVTAISRLSPPVPEPLRAHAKAFHGPREEEGKEDMARPFTYLTVLRNTMQHRRVLLWRNGGETFNIPPVDLWGTGSVYPTFVHVILPDDPRTTPATFTRNIELIAMFGTLLRLVREFILEAYRLAEDTK